MQLKMTKVAIDKTVGHKNFGGFPQSPKVCANH